MSRAIYLLGAPATGKSSTMAALVDLLGLDYGEPFRIWPKRNKQFHGQPLEDILMGDVRGLSLGVARPGGFPGTDALGMAASSEACVWAEEADMPPLVLGEGRRLGTYRFLSRLALRTDLWVAHLVAPDDVLDARCADRGSDQDLGFRKSGKSQAANVAAELEKDQLGTVTHFDTTRLTPKAIARELWSVLR